MTDYFEIMKDISRMHAEELLEVRELLNPDSLPAPATEEAGAGLRPRHSPSVSSVPEGTYFNGGRL